MKQIKFCKNWNRKLTNKVFSTIRRKHNVPEDYYGPKVGQIFDIYLNNKWITKARLIAAPIYKFADIPAEIMLLDTGTSTYQEALEVFYGFYKQIGPAEEFYLLLLERTEEKVIEAPKGEPSPG